MPVAPSAFAWATPGVTAETDEIAVAQGFAALDTSDTIGALQLDSIVAPYEQEIILSSDEISVVEANDNEQITAHRSAFTVSANDAVFGTLEVFEAETGGEPVVSAAE